VKSSDPSTFVSVTALLVAVAFVACSIPAVQATRIDPAVALRLE
jgi:ABC-type lipoprotein release transport system permease subunit